MIRIQTTPVYDKWYSSLRDKTVRNRIAVRLNRIKHGNLGDAKNIGDGVFELRFSFGSGIRIYYTQRGSEIILLLAGGDKSTQENDIKTAKQLAKDIRG